MPSRADILHALAQLPHDERIAILSEAARLGPVTINGNATRSMAPGLAVPALASNRAARRVARGKR
jgi:hypothetical protein